MTFHDIARRTSLLTAIQMALTVGFTYVIAIKMALWLHLPNQCSQGSGLEFQPLLSWLFK